MCGPQSVTVSNRLLTELSGIAVSVELEAALVRCTGVKPRITNDNGSEFCNAELRAVINIRTRGPPPRFQRHRRALEQHRATGERGLLRRQLPHRPAQSAAARR